MAWKPESLEVKSASVFDTSPSRRVFPESDDGEGECVQPESDTVRAATGTSRVFTESSFGLLSHARSESVQSQRPELDPLSADRRLRHQPALEADEHRSPFRAIRDPRRTRFERHRRRARRELQLTSLELVQGLLVVENDQLAVRFPADLCPDRSHRKRSE